jgi:hypothetical protein
MRAVELAGALDENGQLSLNEPLLGETPGPVRVIVLFSEVPEAKIEEIDPDDTPVEEVKASLRRGLQDAKEGKTRPISELWERIDAE